MRVPWSKTYRAFPELDRFSDEECERYVLQVQTQHRLLLAAAPIMAAGLVLVLGCAGMPLLWGIATIGLRRRFSSDPATTGIYIVCIVLAVAFAGLITRDQVLIRRIRARVDNARCTRCRHSLLGLPLLPDQQPEAVRCPECGSLMVLSDIGLVPADLISTPRGDDTDCH